MRILVTGASGFIGGHLCHEMFDAGHDVAPVDISLSRHHDLLDPYNVNSVLDKYKPDVVVHLAAKVGRLFGEDDRIRTVMDNVAMTSLVASECGLRGIRVVYASTSEVYGDNGETVCHEDDGPFTLPHNLYGVTKGVGEDICEMYAPHDLTILRLSMPYGPGLPAGRGRAAMINFLYNALHGSEIPVHRGAERSWCYIGDTVRAIRLVIEVTDGGVFNIGRDDNPELLRTTAERACDMVGASHGLIVDVDPPARQTVVKRLSTQKIRDLGWSPEISLEEGMERTLAFVRTLDVPVLAAVA